jgi:hypothetical protein
MFSGAALPTFLGGMLEWRRLASRHGAVEKELLSAWKELSRALVQGYVLAVVVVHSGAVDIEAVGCGRKLAQCLQNVVRE